MLLRLCFLCAFPHPLYHFLSRCTGCILVFLKFAGFSKFTPLCFDFCLLPLLLLPCERLSPYLGNSILEKMEMCGQVGEESAWLNYLLTLFFCLPSAARFQCMCGRQIRFSVQSLLQLFRGRQWNRIPGLNCELFLCDSAMLWFQLASLSTMCCMCFTWGWKQWIFSLQCVDKIWGFICLGELREGK